MVCSLSCSAQLRRPDENLAGIRVRYGRPEPWKTVRDRYGATKRPTAGHTIPASYVNDGRPPDTPNRLAESSKSKPAEKAKGKKAALAPVIAERGLRTFKNSCWLDTLLEILAVMLQPDLEYLEPLIRKLPPGSLLVLVLETVLYRTQYSQRMEYDVIRDQRDHIRAALVELCPQANFSQCNALLVCHLPHVADPDHSLALPGLALSSSRSSRSW